MGKNIFERHINEVKKIIDFIFISPNIYKYIRACGITTFSQVSPSNHQGTVIDLDLIFLLQNKLQNTIYLSSRLLQLNNIKRVTKYKKISRLM